MSDDGLFSKPKSVRGPNGRFVSKKLPTETKAVSEDDSSSVPLHASAPLHETPESDQNQSVESNHFAIPYAFFDDLSYYGERLRRVYKKNTWFFVIEDMLPLAHITEPLKSIDSFRNSTYFKEALDTHIFLMDVPLNNLGQTKLTLADTEAVNEFIRFLRNQNHFFPGRFPEWIDATSKIDFNDATLAQIQSHEVEIH